MKLLKGKWVDTWIDLFMLGLMATATLALLGAWATGIYCALRWWLS